MSGWREVDLLWGEKSNLSQDECEASPESRGTCMTNKSYSEKMILIIRFNNQPASFLQTSHLIENLWPQTVWEPKVNCDVDDFQNFTNGLKVQREIRESEVELI